VKCHATESTYSKNSSVIPKKFTIYRSCIKSSIEVLKYNFILISKGEQDKSHQGESSPDKSHLSESLLDKSPLTKSPS
jgi:hypothetical protein